MVVSSPATTRRTPSAFGQLLKRLRTGADWTQEELAERAGVSARLISDLERGTIHRPRRDTVRMLADGLDLTGCERDAFCARARERAETTSVSSACTPASLRTGLPMPPNEIVGRLKETAAATAILMAPETRLLSLTGPGGVGKTRLAIEIARRATAAFPDGVRFVDLAPVREAALVVSAIAQACDVKPEGRRPLRDDLIDSVVEWQLLLVLDNVEHVADAATDIADLLAACPNLTMLATSRAPLRIRAEQEYHVEPLVTPDLDALPNVNELAQIPAVDLFLRRAEAANRSFALTEANARGVAEIAVRLDGLPLALELAAARARLLPPNVLLSRLEQRLPLLTGGARDMPARQQAMRTTIDWSYDLLNPTEQWLFRRLSVFARGCPLDAAEDVASRAMGDGTHGADASHAAVLDVLTALVEKSLLRIHDDQLNGPRFGMLETIREYGLDALENAGEEAEARRLHAAWYTELAIRAEPELSGPEQDRWFTRLETEHDNLRTALGWAINSGDAATAMRLSSALWRFWETRGHLIEGRDWLERVLAMEGAVDAGTKGKVAGAAGVMASRQGDHDAALAYFGQAQELYREGSDQTGVAGSLNDMAIVYCALDDYDRARTLHEEALALHQALGNQVHCARVLGNLGMLAHDLHDYDRAADLHREALSIRREVGDLAGVAGSLVGLALVAHARDRYDEATELQEEALSLFHSLGSQVFIAEGFEHLALFAEARRRPERAVRLFGAADAIRQRIGVPTPPYRRQQCEQGIAGARAHLGRDTFTEAWNAGRAMSPEDAIAFALDREVSRSVEDR